MLWLISARRRRGTGLWSLRGLGRRRRRERRLKGRGAERNELVVWVRRVGVLAGRLLLEGVDSHDDRTLVAGLGNVERLDVVGGEGGEDREGVKADSGKVGEVVLDAVVSEPGRDIGVVGLGALGLGVHRVGSAVLGLGCGAHLPLVLVDKLDNAAED